MGYSLTWLAVRGISFPAAAERLGLAPTGEVADYAERDVSARPVSGDWSLVVARGSDHRIAAARQLAALSADCEVIACSIEEHVMYSSCELWLRGQRRWRVVHDAQEGIDHLLASGDLPDDFAATRARFADQQDAEDGTDVDLYFEIPLVLAQSRVGFKHDEVNASEDHEKFQVLRETSPSADDSRRKPWWQFWR
jgi:hypothetical protein